MGLGRKKGPGGGGGVGAILTVTAPAGATVSVSKDGKVKTKISNAEGLAVFKGLKTGTWTLTITDGVQTSTKTVSVTADYSTVIAFFSATINITYPAGSTCTCSDGTTTFTAPDTSGTWVCILPNAGTWTVSCTDGTDSKSEAVSITADGQSVAVELAYWNGELYEIGNLHTDKTGGWNADGWTSSSGAGTYEATINDTGINLITDSSLSVACAGTDNNVDLRGYHTLYVQIEELTDRLAGSAWLGVNSTRKYADRKGDGSMAAMATISSTGTIALDISSVDEGYVAVYAYGTGNAGRVMRVSKIWME